MKLDRLLGILTVLLRSDRVTAPELAAKFEVNRRTIGRDIDTLCQAGIPIVTRQGSGGGLSIAEGYKLDKSVLTADELSGIITAVKGIGSVSERSGTEQILDKFRANSDAVVSLREPVVIDLASHYKGQLTGKIEHIKRAILEARLIEFDYFYEKGEARRRIEPYFVIFQWTSWYVFGFCLERQDWRMFKLLRLWNLSLCDESYSPRDIPPERRDFNTSFPDDINLVAVFDPSERYKLIETYGPNCYSEMEEGLRLEIGFTNRDFMISWLLGFGKRVTVLEPEAVAEEIKTVAKNILSLYEYLKRTFPPVLARTRQSGCSGISGPAFVTARVVTILPSWAKRQSSPTRKPKATYGWSGSSTISPVERPTRITVSSSLPRNARRCGLRARARSLRLTGCCPCSPDAVFYAHGAHIGNRTAAADVLSPAGIRFTANVLWRYAVRTRDMHTAASVMICRMNAPTRIAGGQTRTASMNAAGAGIRRATSCIHTPIKTLITAITLRERGWMSVRRGRR